MGTNEVNRRLLTTIGVIGGRKILPSVRLTVKQKELISRVNDRLTRLQVEGRTLGFGMPSSDRATLEPARLHSSELHIDHANSRLLIGVRFDFTFANPSKISGQAADVLAAELKDATRKEVKNVSGEKEFQQSYQESGLLWAIGQRKYHDILAISL